MNSVHRSAAVKCFDSSIKLDVRCGKPVPLDTETGLVWVHRMEDIRTDGDDLIAWNGYEWTTVTDGTLDTLATVENFTIGGRCNGNGH
jgi:hypothetical protein